MPLGTAALPLEVSSTGQGDPRPSTPPVIDRLQCAKRRRSKTGGSLGDPPSFPDDIIIGSEDVGSSVHGSMQASLQ